jgi:hypothetical protein
MQSYCMGATKTTTAPIAYNLEEAKTSFTKTKAAFLAFLTTEQGKNFIGNEDPETCFKQYMQTLSNLAEIAYELEYRGEMC